MQQDKSGWQYITKYTFADGLTSCIWYNSSQTFIGDGYKTYAQCNYEDDAARQIWGDPWRTPTDAEWTWLLENCDWTWTSNYNGTGKAGMVVTSRVNGYRDCSIFLPAAGRKEELPDLIYDGTNGYYRSSCLHESYSCDTWYLYFKSTEMYKEYMGRCAGLSVRPVCD